MRLHHIHYAATVLCGVLLASGASAQTQSPFGRATPAQEQAAQRAETGRLNALRQWNNLPAQQKERLAAQLANLSNAERLELLRTVPSLRNLSPEAMDIILAQIAKDYPPPTPFAAKIVTAPQNGAFLGVYPYATPVSFIVSGSGLENVELVSAASDNIKYGTFTISADKTRATLEWNPYQWTYEFYNLKVVAWNVPSGQSGQRIEAMEARRYIVKLPLGCGPNCRGDAP